MPPMDKYTKIYAGPGGLPTITYTTAVRLASIEMILYLPNFECEYLYR
jgi:hypothetical protein